jgi:hypothetical protein
MAPIDMERIGLAVAAHPAGEAVQRQLHRAADGVDARVQCWEALDILQAVQSLVSKVPFIFYSGLLLPAQVTLVLQRGA